MRTNKLWVAAALAATATVAHANADWLFAVNGTGVWAAGGVEGCSDLNPDQCLHEIDWRGTLTVVTDSDADGSYGIGHISDDASQWIPGGIVRVTLVSNAGGTDIDAQESPGLQFYPGVVPYDVTVAGGKVTSIQWTSANTPYEAGVNIDQDLQIDGLSIAFQTGTYHGADADVTGTLTPIPEPGGFALSLVGLAAVAWAGRRARSGARTPARRGPLSSAPGSSPAASAPSGS